MVFNFKYQIIREWAIEGILFKNLKTWYKLRAQMTKIIIKKA